MRTLRDDIEALRAIPAEWKKLKDPLGLLEKIRNGNDDDEDCFCENCVYMRTGKVPDVENNQ